jgi:hypothetical protein
MDPAHITVPADLASAPLARSWVRLHLGASDGLRPVEQVVSELIAEAIERGAEGGIEVELYRATGECTVVVTSRERPQQQPVERADLAEHPRLVVVDALSDSLEHRVEQDGRVVMRARITWME